MKLSGALSPGLSRMNGDSRASKFNSLKLNLQVAVVVIALIVIFHLLLAAGFEVSVSEMTFLDRELHTTAVTKRRKHVSSVFGPFHNAVEMLFCDAIDVASFSRGVVKESSESETERFIVPT